AGGSSPGRCSLSSPPARRSWPMRPRFATPSTSLLVNSSSCSSRSVRCPKRTRSHWCGRSRGRAAARPRWRGSVSWRGPRAEELVRRRVLHGVGERFDFTHDRIREVAYAGLLPPRCRFLHRRVAEAIEAVYAGNLEPHALALGRHYRESEAWERAAACLRQAG